MQGDETRRMLQKESDRRRDSTEDESVFNNTLKTQHILQFTECVHGTNWNLAMNIWFSWRELQRTLLK